jgi:hypothetical protein
MRVAVGATRPPAIYAIGIASLIEPIIFSIAMTA